MATHSRLITFLGVVQWLMAAIYFYAALVEISRDSPQREDAIPGLSFGLAVLLVSAMSSLAAGIGLWLRQAWGQRLTIILMACSVAGLAYGWYGGGEWNRDVLPVLLSFAAILTIHLLPSVRRVFRASKLESPASTI